MISRQKPSFLLRFINTLSSKYLSIFTDLFHSPGNHNIVLNRCLKKKRLSVGTVSFVSDKDYPGYLPACMMAACAAATRAMGTRKGEQLT